MPQLDWTLYFSRPRRFG